MPCYSPLQAWRGSFLPSGKRAIVFHRRDAKTDEELSLPCGQCIGCRLARSASWALRCVDEASLYEKNCFLTITYDEVNVPDDGGLVKRDFVLFMKRLRKKYGEGIRFYMCGEYGEESGRPHYHAIVFNFDPPDKFFFKKNAQGDNLYMSPELEKLWDKGFVIVGDVTFDSAAYVARYVLKKKLALKLMKDTLIRILALLLNLNILICLVVQKSSILKVLALVGMINLSLICFLMILRYMEIKNSLFRNFIPIDLS